MLDTYASRKVSKAKEISNIGFVTDSLNLADRLTKPKVLAELYQLLKTKYHKPKVERWIINDPQ